MDDFASLDTPGVSKGVKVVELSAFEKKSAVLGWWRRPGEFFSLLSNVVQFLFYKYGHQKGVFDSANSHNFKSFKKIHSLKP